MSKPQPIDSEDVKVEPDSDRPNDPTQPVVVPRWLIERDIPDYFTPRKDTK